MSSFAPFLIFNLQSRVLIGFPSSSFLTHSLLTFLSRLISAHFLTRWGPFVTVRRFYFGRPRVLISASVCLSIKSFSPQSFSLCVAICLFPFPASVCLRPPLNHLSLLSNLSNAVTVSIFGFSDCHFCLDFSVFLFCLSLVFLRLQWFIRFCRLLSSASSYSALTASMSVLILFTYIFSSLFSFLCIFSFKEKQNSSLCSFSLFIIMYIYFTVFSYYMIL